MDAILIGSVLTFLTGAIGLLGGFGAKMYLTLQRSERRCEARLNINRRRWWFYERELGKLQRITGVDVDRAELVHLDELEGRILMGEADALAEATA